ncbi:MAG: O-succinylbenzoate synthase [Arachnia propionica]|nr:MAG: O-succinylbenzoate synthase [Arachnia propionica]
MTRLQAWVYDIGLITKFRGITSRQGMLFRGPAGWAEWSPFSEYDDAEAARWLAATLEAATLGYPAARRESVAVNAIIPALPPDQAARRALDSGCNTIKIKVAQPGQRLADDIARVSAVRDALGPAAKLRVDANGAWDLDQALTSLRALATYDLEYAEQPCPSTAELASLRRKLVAAGVSVPIAADESIRRSPNPMAARDAADVAILKVQPLGGVRACLRLAEQLALPVVVSSALETSIGLLAGLALARALPQPPLACGLESGNLLQQDVVSAPLRAQAGTLHATPWQVEPEACRANDETAGWWQARLRRVGALVPNWPGAELQ